MHSRPQIPTTAGKNYMLSEFTHQDQASLIIVTKRRLAVT